MKKKNIQAVHDNDLKDLLVKLNLWNKLSDGKLKCKFTRAIITIENLHALFPESGDIKLVCNSPEAIKLFSEYLNEHNI